MKEKPKEQMVLDILNAWKATPVQIASLVSKGSGNTEKRERIALILQIESALHVVFNNPDNINGFMNFRNKHALFDGRRPLDVVAEGDIHTLKRIAEHVKGMALL